MRRWQVVGALLLVLTLVPTSGWAADAGKLTIGVIPGVQLFPLTVIDKLQLAAKHGLQLERKELQNPQAVYVQLSQKGIDLGFVGWTGSFVLRSKGYDVVNIYSFALNNNVVLVKTDSPIKGIADLRGRRLGLYGGPAGLSTATLKIIAKKYYGLDLEKDSKIHYGAPAAQAGLLGKGDLDAVPSPAPIPPSPRSPWSRTASYRSDIKASTSWRAGRPTPSPSRATVVPDRMSSARS